MKHDLFREAIDTLRRGGVIRNPNPIVAIRILFYSWDHGYHLVDKGSGPSRTLSLAKQHS